MTIKSDSRIANVWQSVHQSVIKTPQPIRNIPISHISALAILASYMPLSHRHHAQPHRILAIMLINHKDFHVNTAIMHFPNLDRQT